MEIPNELTPLWFAQVKPNTICKILVTDGTDCVLSNAAVSQGEEYPKDSKVKLFVKVNDNPPIQLINFKIGYFESSIMKVTFSENDNIQFYTEGSAIPIDVSGFLTDGLALSIETVEKTDTK